MTLQTTCSHCGDKIEFDESYVDKDWPCPICGKAIKLLRPIPAMERFKLFVFDLLVFLILVAPFTILTVSVVIGLLVLPFVTEGQSLYSLIVNVVCGLVLLIAPAGMVVAVVADDIKGLNGKRRLQKINCVCGMWIGMTVAVFIGIVVFEFFSAVGDNLDPRFYWFFKR